MPVGADRGTVRVRFAPSPTGPVSLGNIRTALFNWLFARHEGGSFLLRIEDTDSDRSQKQFEDDIVASLTWLGLTWDEELVRQSDRLKLYEKYLTSLIEERKAYYCFCTADELEQERQAQLSQGLQPRYSGKCRALQPEEVAPRLDEVPATIRFKVPDRTVAFSDMVRGKVSVEAALGGDIIIAKGLREPLYNLAATVDDYEMGITHVIRGEDHLSNTPKQLLIQEALGFPHPHYAHLPLILGPDRKKLSKRYLTRSVIDYRNEGYLPPAILNFLVLLGWHPERDREVLSLEEMVAEFTLKRVQKAGAIWNPEKLDWLNGNYIRTVPIEELMGYLRPFVPAHWYEREEYLRGVVALERDRIKQLYEFSKLSGFFFELPDYSYEQLSWQHGAPEATKDILNAIHAALGTIPVDQFILERYAPPIMALAAERGRGNVFWPLRVALSGQEASPAPFDIMAILGRDETMARIGKAIQKIEQGTPS